MMEHFVEYIQSRRVGEGAKSIYQRFKKVVRYAIDHEVMQKDPCKGVVCKVDEQILRKDVLSMDEIQTLIQCLSLRQREPQCEACLYPLSVLRFALL